MAMAASIGDSLGLEILEVRFIRHQKRHELRIVLDRVDRPVSVDDCAEFSRRLSRQMDLDDPISDPYNLNVSSPGFRRLIRIPKDLSRFVNHRVKAHLNQEVQDRTVWIGILRNDSDPLLLHTDEIGDLNIPLAGIKQLNLHE